MARLIDADEAVKLLRGKCVAKYPSTFLMGIFASAAEIEQIPTVDAVPVVHGHWEDAHEIKSFRHTNIPVVKCSKCECYFCVNRSVSRGGIDSICLCSALNIATQNL